MPFSMLQVVSSILHQDILEKARLYIYHHTHRKKNWTRRRGNWISMIIKLIDGFAARTDHIVEISFEPDIDHFQDSTSEQLHAISLIPVELPAKLPIENRQIANISEVIVSDSPGAINTTNSNLHTEFSHEYYICNLSVLDSDNIQNIYCVRRYHPRCFLRMVILNHNTCPNRCPTPIVASDIASRTQALSTRLNYDKGDIIQERLSRQHACDATYMANLRPATNAKFIFQFCHHLAHRPRSNSLRFDEIANHQMQWSSYR